LVKGQLLEYSDSGDADEETGVWRDIVEEGKGWTEVYFRETDGVFYVRIWKAGD